MENPVAKRESRLAIDRQFMLRGGKISEIIVFNEKNVLTRSDAYNIISQCGYV